MYPLLCGNLYIVAMYRKFLFFYNCITAVSARHEPSSNVNVKVLQKCTYLHDINDCSMGGGADM